MNRLTLYLLLAFCTLAFALWLGRKESPWDALFHGNIYDGLTLEQRAGNP